MKVLSHCCAIPSVAKDYSQKLKQYFNESWTKNGWQVEFSNQETPIIGKKKQLFDNIHSYYEKEIIRLKPDPKDIIDAKDRNYLIFERFFFANTLPDFRGLICETDIINKNFKIDDLKLTENDNNIILYEDSNPSAVFFPNRESISNFIDLLIEVTSSQDFLNYRLEKINSFYPGKLIMLMEFMVIRFLIENDISHFSLNVQNFVKNLIIRNEVLYQKDFYETDLINNYKLFHINQAASGQCNKNEDLIKKYPHNQDRRIALIEYMLTKVK